MKRKPTRWLGAKSEMAKEAEYYDDVYRRTVAGNEPLAQSWTEERNRYVIPHIAGHSVLDLGCGLGAIANFLQDMVYFGVDFSPVAILEARRTIGNPNAHFWQADIFALDDGFWMRISDTVLLLEILEYVEQPAALANIALRCAKRRIVVTVPRDMPGRAHVTPIWTERMLRDLFGDLSVCELFGGETADRWWLAVKDMRRRGG